jgi:uncharacterized RDD family membrane protein YckC
MRQSTYDKIGSTLAAVLIAITIPFALWYALPLISIWAMVYLFNND